MSFARSGTLTANTASAAITVTFRGTAAEVTVLNRSTSDYIWATIDGSDPTIAGNDCVPIPPGWSVALGGTDSRTSGTASIKLISSGAAPYSVVVP